MISITCGHTPSSQSKIRVFSDPTLGKSWRRRQTTYQKRFLGNPNIGTNPGSRILAMRTGCVIHEPLIDMMRTETKPLTLNPKP